MQVLLVLEDERERRAMQEVSVEFGFHATACASVEEAQGLLHGKAWDALLVRRGRRSLALRGLLRAASKLDPAPKIYLLGANRSTMMPGEDSSDYSGGPSVEVLAEGPASEIAVRMLGLDLSKPAAILEFESLKQISSRRTWTSSLARERATGATGVLATIDPLLIDDEEVMSELRASLPPALAVDHPLLAPAVRIALDPPVPLVFWSVPFGLPLPALEGPGLRLPVEGAVALAVQLSEALAALHRAGVTHGAVDTWAVWVCGDGTVRLLHRGLAAFAERLRRRRRDSRFPLPFMEDGLPPEELVEESGPSRAGDVYGVGLVLYELLCGERPFARRDPLDAMKAVVNEGAEPPIALRPDVPQALSDLVLSMLDKSPGARPADGGALVEALTALLPTAGGLRRLLGGRVKPAVLLAGILRERIPRMGQPGGGRPVRS